MQDKNEETEFRISSDSSVSISKAEVEAQQEAQRKLDDLRRREGKFRDLNGMDLHDADLKVEHYRQRGVQADNVRHGMSDGSIRMPSDESFQGALEAGDVETAHLYNLQQVKPGTPEFMAKAPPPEEVIEVFGPKGAEGFGIVKKLKGTGPGAGIDEV